ncbi:MLO-like protein 4 isoform X1 [Dioscorea cayenensis subsp. rotundata]|uniref:MLO-like protein n=1 Tax=Dioscorea cayennensis subsp. rotundata TaxID=55577 RepID=A0AB40D108_DIOCR|nr:MLO-like protein 4 isoform X1 [Dioscorea cayenensis subsp. rotundata]
MATMERSLPDTPTWSIVTVLIAMVLLGTLIHVSILRFRKWLLRTQKKPLLAAVETIMQDIMVFGLLSLLMGHWTVWISHICIKETAVSNEFYPCLKNAYVNNSHSSRFWEIEKHGSCPQGLKPFVTHGNLESLHRLLLVLGAIHVLYCLLTVILAMLQIDSWRAWEVQAENAIIQNMQDGLDEESIKQMLTKHRSRVILAWSKNKVFIWMTSFFRQFWSSVDETDYMALRLSFIHIHKLHLSYNFHKYLLRSMDDEFQIIVGISVPVWGYAIICVLLNVHGSSVYYWISLLPFPLILIVGTKLQNFVMHVTPKIRKENQSKGKKRCNELFRLGQSKFLLWLVQVISFQNAFEMATLMWSLWEINSTLCYMENQLFIMIRLTVGMLFQFWSSYFVFPLYVIVTQMGPEMKKSVFSKSVRESLHNWSRRSKHSLQKDSFGRSLTTTSSLVSLDLTDDDKMDEIIQEENTCLNSFGTVKMHPGMGPEMKLVFSKSVRESLHNWSRRSKHSLQKDSSGRSLTTITSSLVSLDLTDDDKMDEIIQEETHA